MYTSLTRLATTAAIICLVVGITWALRTSAQHRTDHHDERTTPVAAEEPPAPSINTADQDYGEWLTALAVQGTQEMEQALREPIPTVDPNITFVTPTGPTPTLWQPLSTPLAGGGVIVAVAPVTHAPIVSTSPWMYIEQDDRRIVIIAGAEIQREHPDDKVRTRSQGIVLVREETLELDRVRVPKILTQAVFYTPQRLGPVRITDVNGMVLELTAEDGTTFVFDVAARAFIER